MTDRPYDMNDRLAELLLAWEESVAAGRSLTPADLCRDCPDLLDDLEREIQRLEAVDRFMYSRTTARLDGAAEDGAPDSGDIGFPTLPGYEVLEELGRGGMGVVYKARQQSLGRLVAVKTLAGSRWGQPGFVARLRQEAKALSVLNHRHVVQVIDVIETPAAVSLVLEYVDGESLSRRLNGAPLAPKEAAQLTHTLARALASVHERGVLHRDIKPGNVLIDRAGVLKISDFGLAKETGNTDGLTMTGEVLGSPGYMAPEQAEGRMAEVDARTDVYAVGATLYEMLTGRPPFVAGSVVETLDHVRYHEPASPRLLNPGVPPDLETICLRCLEKEPGRRFATARDLVEELDRFLRGEPIRSRPIGTLDRSRRWCRRYPAAASLVVVSCGALAVILAGLFVYNQDLARLNADLAAAAANARELQGIAEDRERQAKDSLYAADVSRAAMAWRDEDTRGLTELLDRHIPPDGEPDRRGFGWWYLRWHTNLAHRKLLDVDSALYILSSSPDRRTLAAAGRDAIVWLFDSETGAISRSVPTGQIEVNGVAFSPNGRELATAGDDGTIRLWNLDTGEERLKLDAHPEKAFQVLFTPDGGRIVSCGDNPVIRVFDAASGREGQTLRGHQTTVQSLALSADGTTLISTGNDQTARFWDLLAARETSRVTSGSALRAAVVTKDLRLVITGNNQGRLESWNARDGRKISEARHLDAIEALALHPDENLLAAGDRGGSIRVWRLGADGELVAEYRRMWQGHRAAVHSLIWSTDGSRLVSAGGDGRVIDWSSATATHSGRRSFDVGPAQSFCLIPGTTSLIISSGQERSLTRWDWSLGKLENTLPGIMATRPAASPDGKCIAVSRDDRSLEVFPIDHLFDRPPAESRIIAWAPGGELGLIRFSPDSLTVAVSFQRDGTEGQPDARAVWLHGPPNFGRMEQVPIAGAKVVAFSPDGRRIALGRDAGLVLWELSPRKTVWETPQSDFAAVAFSPDGKLLVTGGASRLVIVRNAADGSIRYRFASHRSRINSFAFSPDNTTLATASEDGVIKLWHLPTGQELFDLTGPGPECLRLEFSEDGRNLLAHISPDPLHHEILVFINAGEHGK